MTVKPCWLYIIIASKPSRMSVIRQGYITVGYRGTFAIGRGDMSTTGFRKLGRILVCGKSALCREVFKDTLNESRDPDRGLDGDRYTARYFLKHR